MANSVLRNYFIKIQPFIYATSSSCRVTAPIVLNINNSNIHRGIRNLHSRNYLIQENKIQWLKFNLREKLSQPISITLKKHSTFSEDKVTRSNVLHDSKNSDIENFREREEQREEQYSNEHRNTTNDEKNDEKIKEIRSKIMDAALPFVSNYGWSREAITKGAESIGYPGVVHGMFPNGGIELIHYFYLQCNQKLINELILESEKNKNANKTHNPTEFVTIAIQLRLKMIEPYLTHWPQALGLMALPPNAQTSLAQLLTLVDDICFYSGDRSVDFGWYTRRIGLAAIYKLTELYMLQDKSIEHVDTWKFLQRRIEEGHQILEVFEVGDTTTKSALNSAFLTARNILGLNFNRR